MLPSHDRGERGETKTWRRENLIFLPKFGAGIIGGLKVTLEFGISQQLPLPPTPFPIPSLPLPDSIRRRRADAASGSPTSTRAPSRPPPASALPPLVASRRPPHQIERIYQESPARDVSQPRSLGVAAGLLAGARVIRCAAPVEMARPRHARGLEFVAAELHQDGDGANGSLGGRPPPRAAGRGRRCSAFLRMGR